jgi:hypothetical protein
MGDLGVVSGDQQRSMGPYKSGFCVLEGGSSMKSPFALLENRKEVL